MPHQVNDRQLPAGAPRARGPKPRFTRAQIVEQALELLCREGRAALNLRRLAKELRVTPMALYRYFADKDELLDAIVATVLEPADAASSTDVAWDVQLAATLRDMHDALKAVPAVAEILALRRPGEQLDPLRKRLFAITAEAGLTEQEAADTLRAATSFVIGFTLITSPEERHRRYAASADSFSFGLELIMRSARELANSRGRR